MGKMEERVFDEGTGLQLTASLETYKLPTVMDTPGIEVSFLDRADVEANSVGARGLGEPPIIPAPAAVATAVADAIGIRITELPLTPPRVLETLESGGEVRR
jgi:xanthine dehydrogenase YagR molybdenum-binding subunit